MVSSALRLKVQILDEGIYRIFDEEDKPDPLVILIGSGISHFWPQRDLVLRFSFVG